MCLRYYECTVECLDILAKISKETFIAAFEKDNNAEDFRDYIDSAFSKAKLLQELQHPSTKFYFTYFGKNLVGYFKINEHGAQSDPQGVDSLELERIYVLSKHQGKGIGIWMLNQIIAIAKEQQKTYIWLGVWEQNPKAIKFYKRHGFKKFGEHAFDIGSDRQTDWLMRYDL